MMGTTMYGGRGSVTGDRWPGSGDRWSVMGGRGSVIRGRWSGIWLPLLVALALFHWSGPLLRMADPTAAVVDHGALSLVLLALVAVLAFVAVGHWLLGLIWPVLRDYQRNHFANNFKSLQPWQKITFYLVVCFGLLYAFVGCLLAMF